MTDGLAHAVEHGATEVDDELAMLLDDAASRIRVVDGANVDGSADGAVVSDEAFDPLGMDTSRKKSSRRKKKAKKANEESNSPISVAAVDGDRQSGPVPREADVERAAMDASRREASAATTSDRTEAEAAAGDADETDGVHNLVKQLRQIQTDARSAADGTGDAGVGTGVEDDEEMLASMIQELSAAMGNGFGGGADGSNGSNMQSLVDSMMSQLLSREVLHKPMTEIRDKYPPWLSENKDKLDDADYKRYEQQYKYVCEVCRLYEEEEEKAASSQGGASSPSSGARGSEARIMEVMQLMQECGQPPKELVRSSVRRAFKASV